MPEPVNHPPSVAYSAPPAVVAPVTSNRAASRAVPRGELERRHDVQEIGFNLRAMLAACVVVTVERVQPALDLFVNVERIDVGQGAIADAQVAFLGDHVERDPAVHRSEIQHVVRRVGKNLRVFGRPTRRQLLLITADSVDDAGHHGDRVDAAGRCAAVAADAADGHAERHDALVRERHFPRSRLADPRQPRDRRFAKDLL